MYELLGISLVLATLLTINALASLAAAAGWRLFGRFLRIHSARTRAQTLFALRIVPPAVALMSVALFLVPAYLGYEPHATSEVVSKKLAAMAIISAAGVLFALTRGLRSWFATRTLRRKWLAHGRRTNLNGIDIPTFRISHAFPVIAVVGTLRPRLFIAERVLQTLSEDELTAAIAHECGHLAARDNFKRSLLRICRDVLMIVPCGRSLDRAWAEAAECAADEHAAGQSADTALNLASALVKIARIVPVGMRARMPVAAFLVGGEETRGVKTRVRRLLELASSDNRSPAGNRRAGRFFAWVSVGLLVALSVVVQSIPEVLASVHVLVERVVFLLS